MNLTFKEKFAEQYLLEIQKIINSYENKIIVLKGFPRELKESLPLEYIVDFDSFDKEVGSDILTKEWFTSNFVKLSQNQKAHILSYGQFAQLIEYIDASFFKDRVIIIQDNLRKLYPLINSEYLIQYDSENIEYRPDNIPVHHIEHLQIVDEFYYVSRDLLDEFEIINLFSENKEILDSQYIESSYMIDLTVDMYALDIFVNFCLNNEVLPSKISVKLFEKQELNKEVFQILLRLNGFLVHLNSEIFKISNEIVNEEYEVKTETIALFDKYWPKNKGFRNITIYKNPEKNKETIEISQGRIVETIINEYENARLGNAYRDLFLTAPTGAGKSLLFQLPAFYISSQNDITIVVSPLIALMKDQVEALIKDRKFEKVAYLNSELSLIEREEILQDCHTGKIDILYLSPELLLSYDISFFIGERKLGLLVIDEAHLITTWGRDFRVDYWFIGNHIRKIRKYSGNSFPMVAVTATAIYGGSNDMVFDCIESLAMNDRHAFIGLVKRNDINFFVNNYQQFNQNYQKNKVKQTADFIAQIEKNTNFKTLVYVPYSSHVNKITEELTSRGLEISTGYFGRLDSDLKVKAFDEFKSGEKQIMVSTKAFGMGVDISDIQVVYHHAPSGLLPDYIQEVGRLARREDLTGYAALNYTEQDKSYSKALYGMSAIRPQQLSEVLKKIVSIYKNQKRKNLLISTDDFAHIFEDSDSIDQKVLTSLMMIEKDYIEKTRFNVLIARPKKLFVKVFARIKTSDRDFLLQNFSNEIEEVSYKYLEERGFNIISIDLDKIWTKYFPQQSFPKLKSDFYKEKLFTFFNKNLEVTPLLNINYDLNFEFNDAYRKFDNILQIIGTSFFNLSNHFFKEDDLYNELNIKLNNIDFSRKLTKFLLSNYSGRFTAMNRIEPNVFLQKKLNIDEYSYRLINNLHSREFSNLRTKFSRIFQNEDKLYKRFVTNKDSISISYIRLGYFLDILDLGTFEIKGGESPMIFLRLNDPKRIEKDSKGYYKNILLEKTMQRHNLSNKIFDHFFMNTFTNNERWNFIEDFFLGKEIDDLIEEYPGNGPISELNIIEKLKEKFIEQNKGQALIVENSDVNRTVVKSRVYYADPSKTYYDDTLLTIDLDGVPTTKKVEKWLVDNVIEFDKVRKKHKLNLPAKVFEIMVSKLRQHEKYFMENLSINHMIEYPGHNVKVKAIVPFNNNPVKFYKWYLENPNSLILNFRDKIKVFSKVYELDKKALKQEHLNLIKK